MRFGEHLDRNRLVELTKIPGRLEREAEEIRIVMPMEVIDLRIHRAGARLKPGRGA